jgi:superoxide dismutase
MAFLFFDRFSKSRKKIEADGDLLIQLLGEGALAMATENALKSTSRSTAENHHHSRVRTYVKNKLGMPAYQDLAT